MTRRSNPLQRWAPVALALAWITGTWWLFVWRYLTPVAADRLMLARGDFTYVFYTLYRELPYRAFQKGEFPWRTLCLFGGYPLQADPQSALFYPGVWLTLFFSWILGTPHVSMAVFHVESLIHLWIAAVLAYVFLLREVGNRWGALLGALVFAFGGYMTGYPILQVAKGESTAWLPLFLLGLRDLADGRIPRGLLLGGVGGALVILPGDPQIAFYILLGGTAYYAFRCAQSRLPWLPAVQRLGLLGLLIAGTTAVQLLPTLEYQQHSTRVRLPLSESGTGFPVYDIVQMLQPGLVSHWQPLYVGLLPLALALLGIAAGGPQARFWGILGLVALLLSFGTHFPLYEAIFQAVPFYATTRSQERHALWVSFSLAVLAASGLAVLQQGLPRPQRGWFQRIGSGLRALAWIFIGTLPMIIFLARMGIDPSDHRRLPQEVGLSALMALGAWGWWAARGQGWRDRRASGLMALTLTTLNLAAFNRYLDAIPPTPVYPEHPAAAWMAQDPHRPFRFYDEWRLPDNFACWIGAEDIDGATSIHPQPYDRFLRETPEPLQWWLLGVRYVITWGRDLPDMQALGRTAVLLQEIPQGQEITRIFRLDPPLPWGWVVRKVRTVASVAEMLAALQDPAFRPAEEAVVLGPVNLPAVEAPAPGPDEIFLLHRTATESRYRVRLGSPGLLLVRDPWYPGWTASVNGQPAPLYRADGVLMAVALPAGESEVVFRFRPLSFLVGAGISLCTIAFLWPWVLWRSARRP